MTTYDDKEEKAEAIPEPSAALLELLSPAPGSLITLHLSFSQRERAPAGAGGGVPLLVVLNQALASAALVSAPGSALISSEAQTTKFAAYQSVIDKSNSVMLFVT